MSKDLSQVILRALDKLEPADMKSVLASTVSEYLQNYDCRNDLLTVLQPLVKTVAIEMLKDPIFQQAFQDRIKAQMLSLIQTVKVTTDHY